MSRILRKSSVLETLRAKKNPIESQRVRTSMMLSARIATALKNKKWNKGDLAKALNKNPSIITRWLSGTHNFTSDTLSDIQVVLGIQLLVRSEEEQKQIVGNYSLTDSALQGKMLDTNSMLWKNLLSAEPGGCTEARSFTLLTKIDKEEVVTL